MPILDRLDRLPTPQRDALSVAFGLSAQAAAEPLLVGLATLGLLSEAAEERPLLCLVDDIQWLDQASVQTLEFVARRLVAESVALIFAVRDSGGRVNLLASVPDLIVEGLGQDDAKVLLSSVIQGPLDLRVRDQVVAETRGNPLALLELPRGLTPAELAGGFGMLGAAGLEKRIEETFTSQLAPLPADTRRLLLLAAADPLGEPVLVWRAAQQLGVGSTAADAAEDAGLLTFGTRVTFRHPMIRSSVYWSASPAERREAHRSLAQATDPSVNPDRRAWHLAQATSGPDEDVAAELERSADRAQKRGGLAAAAAFLERSAELTFDTALRADRALAAAEAKYLAGGFDAALDLLDMAQTGPLNEFQAVRIDLLRGQVSHASSRGAEAPLLLLKAANRLQSLEHTLARETYRDAFLAALFAGRFAGSGGVLEVAAAVSSAVKLPVGPLDLLLVGFAQLHTGGYAEGAPVALHALSTIRSLEISKQERLRWLSFACRVAHDVWDYESYDALSSDLVNLARDEGALSVLGTALSSKAACHIWGGDLAAAGALTDESQVINASVWDNDRSPYAASLVAAWRGREADTRRMIEVNMTKAMARGEGQWLTSSDYELSVLNNALGRPKDALAAAERASTQRTELGYSNWALIELIEAAVRSGAPETATATHERLVEVTSTGTEWASGLKAYTSALLSEGPTAEALYRKAISHLERSRVRAFLARAHLLYGEWLRRERRRREARDQLRTAFDLFSTMGAEAFAERAKRELRVTGETARKRITPTIRELTAQELQVARYARDGLSNPDIGLRLFISPKTVEYHMRKVFTKLGINSRTQLESVVFSNTDVG